MDLTAISAATGSLKAALDITKALVDLNISQAVQAKILELQRKMLDTQQAMLTINEERATLVERIGTLEKELAAQEAWAHERERYELTEFVPGFFGYRLKPEESSREPGHLLCANCYQTGKKSILQGNRLQKHAGFETLHCHACKAELRYFRGDLPVKPKPRLRPQPDW